MECFEIMELVVDCCEEGRVCMLAVRLVLG